MRDLLVRAPGTSSTNRLNMASPGGSNTLNLSSLADQMGADNTEVVTLAVQRFPRVFTFFVRKNAGINFDRNKSRKEAGKNLSPGRYQNKNPELKMSGSAEKGPRRAEGSHRAGNYGNTDSYEGSHRAGNYGNSYEGSHRKAAPVGNADVTASSGEERGSGNRNGGNDPNMTNDADPAVTIGLGLCKMSLPSLRKELKITKIVDGGQAMEVNVRMVNDFGRYDLVLEPGMRIVGRRLSIYCLNRYAEVI
jgi:hypothetical protein